MLVINEYICIEKNDNATKKKTNAHVTEIIKIRTSVLIHFSSIAKGLIEWKWYVNIKIWYWFGFYWRRYILSIHNMNIRI